MECYDFIISYRYFIITVIMPGSFTIESLLNNGGVNDDLLTTQYDQPTELINKMYLFFSI